MVIINIITAYTSHTSHWAGARGVLGVEKIVFLLWSLPCQRETVIFLKKGIESIRVCPEGWQNATWKWSQERLQKHSKYFHSFWPMPRKDSPSSPPYPHPHPPHVKKKIKKSTHPLVIWPFIWLTIIGKGLNCLPH